MIEYVLNLIEQWSPNDIAVWVSTGVAVFSAVAAILASRDASRWQREAAQHTARQHELQLRSWADQHFIAVREWANQVCFAISDAIHLLGGSHTDEKSKCEILSKLSALIDTGRWYFPNVRSDEVGTDRPPAYRGKRQEVLDWIVNAYDIIENSAAHEHPKIELIEIQRQFVSAIQTVLDPRGREKEIDKVLAQFGQQRAK